MRRVLLCIAIHQFSIGINWPNAGIFESSSKSRRYLNAVQLFSVQFEMIGSKCGVITFGSNLEKKLKNAVQSLSIQIGEEAQHAVHLHSVQFKRRGSKCGAITFDSNNLFGGFLRSVQLIQTPVRDSLSLPILPSLSWCLNTLPPQMNLEDFQGVPLREWIAQDATRREIKRRFQSFLLTFQQVGMVHH